MADILDATGVKIGETRPNQDPNAPTRFIHTESDQYFVIPANKTELEVMAEIPVAAHVPPDGRTAEEIISSPWSPEMQAIIDEKEKP